MCLEFLVERDDSGSVKSRVHEKRRLSGGWHSQTQNQPHVALFRGKDGGEIRHHVHLPITNWRCLGRALLQGDPV